MHPTLLTLHDPGIARHYYETGEWRGDTLYGLAAEHARARPLAPAVSDSRCRLSWSELVARADAAAADLSAAGLRQGDRVGIWLSNRVEVVVALLACSRAGFVAVPSLHRNHTVGEIATLMERCRAAALLFEPGYGADAESEDIVAAAGKLLAMRRLYALPTSGTALPAGAAPFPAAHAEAGLVPPVSNPDKVCYLAFTSGTTGQPKGVMHSDNTLLANGRAMVRDWNLDASTVLYSLSPLSHHIGTVALEQTLVAGCELVINDLPKGQSPLDRIIETGATYVMGVPTHAIDLLGEFDRRGLSGIGSVKIFYMAGSQIPIEVARRFIGLGIVPQNVYGMTENGSHQYTRPDDDLATMVRTCGKPCSAYDIRIWQVDAPDIEASQGEVGEIGGRGACLMLGYFGNQTATETSFNAYGWFMSGDLGRFDENGNLEIVGRSKDLIIRGGHNIYPSQIENLAIRHPAVFKVAALPVPDDRLGERVCLAVIAKDGAEVEPADMLRQLAEAGLSKYDMPEYFLRLDAFPLTASGKIQKRDMVAQIRSGVLRPQPIPRAGATIARSA